MSAISALKGYRTQFLYSLYYILSNQDKNFKFHLEGKEDLDILDGNNNLLQVIQVKNLSTPLTQSDLISKDGTSFFKRVIEIRNQNTGVTPILVSFGPISNELKNFGNNNALSNKEKKDLGKYSIKEADWQMLKQSVQWIEVNEETIYQSIISLLKVKYALLDPVVTADFVIYWLSVLAEKQIIISQTELFVRIEAMGHYLSERESINQLYNLVIKPLHQIDASAADLNKLKNEFYYGVSAKYEHILNNIDVVRPEFVNNIKDLFTQSNVVIIQGASGQGKSTLAYRYLHDNLPSSLIYELNIPNDSLLSIKSIQALLSITKNLHTPILFLIHVLPNTTEWVKIVREFADTKFVNFLITIRYDDWYTATTNGLNFLYKDIELDLKHIEAEQIYNSLNNKSEVIGYTDFEEAWIKFGENGPLLEFVYSITQGQPLRDKLTEQISQIKNDAAISQEQIEILRIVSLADSYGARVDVSKVKQNPYAQTAIERFEKEYLLKQINKKKYIVGLHPVRSNILTVLLFDEFITCKKDYVIKCISLIDDSDIYYFLLHCFLHKVIEPSDLLISLKDVSPFNWTSFRSIFKSLLWAGIRDYIEENKAPLDECYNKSGDSWIVLTDIYHGNTLDLKDYQKFMSEDFKQLSAEINDKLKPKEDVYKHASHFLNSITLPVLIPTSNDCWASLGEMMFWLKNIPNSSGTINSIAEENFEEAFKTLDLTRLSKLMLGMYYYSDLTNGIRNKFGHYFVNGIRNTYKVPELKVDTNEIHVNYIIDLFQNADGTSLNDGVMEIIDLVRYAYPDKERYNAQGHGHRLPIYSFSYDEAHKSISIQSLPLDEWVNLNATTINLYEYKKRPTDWIDFYKQLSEWETTCSRIIKGFNNSFSSFYNNPTDLKPLVHLIDNAQYRSVGNIKEPQLISAPFGLAIKKSSKVSTLINKNKSENGNYQAKLFSKYKPFFKAHSSFKLSLENFIKQSAAAIYWKIMTIQKPETQVEGDNERLSQINLVSAIEQIQSYSHLKKENFSKYERSTSDLITKESLFTSLAAFKQFNPGNNKPGKSNGQIINQLYSDFETKILKGCKSIPKESGYHIKYLKNKATGEKATFTITVENYSLFILGIKEVYNIIKNAIGAPEHTSLKQAMLQESFSEFYFISIVKGHTINNQWYKFLLYVIRDKEFDQLAVYNWTQAPIDQEIVSYLKITSWETKIPGMVELKKLAENFTKVRVLAEHLDDLKYFLTTELDEIGSEIVKTHYTKTVVEIQQSFQYILDLLTSLPHDFPYNEEKYLEDEFERLYCDAIINIKDNIFPTAKGNEEKYEIFISAEIIAEWVKRLEKCSASIGVLNFLIIDKFIKRHLSAT